MEKPGQVTVERDRRAPKDSSRLVIVQKDVGVGPRRTEKRPLRDALASVPLKVVRCMERDLLEGMDLRVRFILS